MKKRVLGYGLSVASIYITTGYLTKLFIELMSNFTINIV